MDTAHQTKIEQVKHTLAQRMREGVYQPGERLPAAEDLAKALQVSRQTIRSALERLAVERRVRIKPSSGTFVCDVWQQRTDHPEHVSSQQRALVERVAERAALFQIRGENFTHCLRLNHVATERTVVTKQGKKVTLRGQVLADPHTWTSFVHQQKIPFSWLLDEEAGVAVSYAHWLRTSQADGYCALSTQEEVSWLEQVARLAVLWHLMLHRSQTHSFFDPWVALEMGKMRLLREVCRDLTRAVQQGIKEPEHALDVLQQVYRRCLSLIEDRTSALDEGVVPVPPAPPDLLTWPAEEQRHEEREQDLSPQAQ